MNCWVRLAASGLLCALTCASAQAERGAYLGGLVSRTAYQERGLQTRHPGAIALVLGQSFSPSWALELRMGAGMGSSSDLAVENYLGAYLRGSVLLSQSVHLYGLAGFTRAQLKASNGGAYAGGGDSGLSAGLGADYFLTPATSIGVEWARLFSADRYDLDALTVSFKLHY